MGTKRILETLCAAVGPSGHERRVTEAAAALLEPLVDEVRTDALGNLIGVRYCGRPNARRLLLDAHLDEVGFLVTNIVDGFLRFRSIGSVDPRVLLNSEVTVLTPEPMPGVVACLPPHVLSREELNESIPVEKMLIDVGLSDEEARRRIPLGTPAVFRGSFGELGREQVWGKSLDDRSCFAVLLRTAELLAEQKLNVDLYFMGSVQEEISGGGAAAGIFGIDPDWAVAADVTHGRTPDAETTHTLLMGGGPAIGVGPNMNRAMTEELKTLARERNIPFQLEIMSGNTGTNAWGMQVAREGYATAVVSLPLKYMHTPAEVVRWDDMENTARLLAAYAETRGGDRDR
ncbi:MAG: M20/M25/M40 family metallo-hydrolase [Oscillospiraceae bacterium]|nr:M20/M25/M40 family metallo-hydrolase [Oscillospiraceae bacterium]